MKRLIIILTLLSLLLPAPALAQEEALAALMPADVDMYVWLNLARFGANADRVNGILRHLGIDLAPLSRDMILQAALDDLFWSVELDYRSDVAPWLGDQVALGIQDFTTAALVTAYRDRSAALAALQRVLIARKQMGLPLEERIYQDVPLYQEQSLALALTDEHFIAGSPALVEAILETAAGHAPSLAAEPDFAPAMEALPAESAGGLFWGAPPPINEDIGLSTGGVALSVRLQADAALLDMAVALDSVPFGDEPLSGRVFQAVPDDAIVMLAGHELPAWRELLEAGLASLQPLAADWNHRLVQAGYAGPSPTGLMRLAERWPVWIEGFTGLDVEEDVLAWMGDEFALALVPLSPHVISGHTSRVPFNMLAVVEVADSAGAEHASAHMRDRLVELGFPVMTQTPHSMGMHVVRLAQHPRAYLGWTQTEAFAALSSGVWPVVRFLDTLYMSNSMLQNPRLVRALDRLDGTGHVLLFIDMQEGLPYLLRSLPDTSPVFWMLEENRPILEAVESIALAGRTAGEAVYAATLVVMFGE